MIKNSKCTSSLLLKLRSIQGIPETGILSILRRLLTSESATRLCVTASGVLWRHLAWLLLRKWVEHSNSVRKSYLYSIKDSMFRVDLDPNKSTTWTAVSNPIYNEVRVVPNKFKSNPVNPTHELGFLKPKHKSTMNSAFKSSKLTCKIQEENLPTVLSSISKRLPEWQNSQSIRFQNTNVVSW